MIETGSLLGFKILGPLWDVWVRIPLVARMNIFVVDESPAQAARDLCNKHVVKMIVESAQILSTVFRLKMEEKWGLKADVFEHFPKLYKLTHKNHPVVKWTMKSVNNTEWLWQHLVELENEYKKRYCKFHRTSRVIIELGGVRWSIWNSYGNEMLHTEFVQCMPDQYKNVDPIIAYRQFYVCEKAKFAKWYPRTIPPKWWLNKQS